jgi:uncharacterized protein (DUF433 family)
MYFSALDERGIKIMVEAKIINRGRGPEIAGTRITVYTIFEYVQNHWRPEDMAFWLNLRKDQVDVAIRYIEDHQEEVAAQFAKIMERINRGNPPELQEKLDAAHAKFQGMLRERRQVNGQEAQGEGNPGGQ